jgi:type IV secretory pathway VirB2 component (pilin)
MNYMHARIIELVQACSVMRASVMLLKDALFVVQPCSIQEMAAVAMQASQTAHRICDWAAHLHGMAAHLLPGTPDNVAIVSHLLAVSRQSFGVQNQLQRIQPVVTGPVSHAGIVHACSASVFALEGSDNACAYINSLATAMTAADAAVAGEAVAAA